MKYLLDAAVILIFLLCVAIGHKRGFIKTVTGIVALVAGLLGASLFCGPAAELVYDKAVAPSIVTTVDTKLEELEGREIERLDAAYQEFPAVVKNLLAQVGIEDVDDLAQKMPEGGQNSAGESVNSLIRPLLLPLIKAVCSLLLFLIVYIVASILLRALNLVAKLPLLKQLNKTLGLIGGAVAGVLWSLLAVTLMQILAATGVTDGALTLQTIGETAVVNWLIGINPLGGAFLDVLNAR